MTYPLISKECEKFKGVKIEGDIIPTTWRHWLRKEIKSLTKKETRTKVDIEAIIILATLVYWYRPRLIRNEYNENDMKWEQKFKADKLQKSYADLADHTGFTKRQVKDAVKRLEDFGVLTREFRTIKVGGNVYPNILFVEVHADVVDRISNNLPMGYDTMATHPQHYGDTPDVQKRHTITENTTETTSKSASNEARCVSGETHSQQHNSIGQGNDDTIGHGECNDECDVAVKSHDDNILLESRRKPRRFLIPKNKSTPAVQFSSHMTKADQIRAKQKDIKPPKKKPNKPFIPANYILPFIDAVNTSSLRHHERNTTATYKNLAKAVGKLIRGKFYTTDHVGCEHMIGRKVTLPEFTRAVHHLELLVHSPEHAPKSESIKNAWAKYGFNQFLYNNFGNGNKSLFATYFDKPPKKLDKVVEETLRDGQKRALLHLVNEYEKTFNCTLNHNGDMKYAINCIKYTIPKFFTAIQSKIKKDSYIERIRSLTDRTTLWIEMLGDMFGGMEHPNPAILNSENTIRRAHAYFGKNYHLHGYDKHSRTNESDVTNVLTELGIQ
jgi:DNA-binding MarR family transcriptional regulator